MIPKRAVLEFLLSVIRVNAGAAAVPALSEPDWAALLPFAGRHGVMPLFWQSLPASFAVPAAAQARLVQRTQTNTLRNLHLAGQTHALLQHLDAAGILAVPFKGLPLAELAYGGLSLRELSDLDILVRPVDAEPARRCLLAAGYRPLSSAHYAHKFRLPEFDTIVELHWNVVGFDIGPLRAIREYVPPLTLVELVPRLQTIDLAGKPVPTIAPADLLYILCRHGSKHQWERLKWLVDVDRLIHACPDMDWDHSLHLAERFGSPRMLFLGLHLAQTLLGTPLPAPIEQGIATEPAVIRLGARVRHWLFTSETWWDKLYRRPDYLRQLWDNPQLRRRLWWAHLLYPLQRRGNLTAKQKGKEMRAAHGHPE